MAAYSWIAFSAGDREDDAIATAGNVEGLSESHWWFDDSLKNLNLG